jgi:hypothetical protein
MRKEEMERETEGEKERGRGILLYVVVKVVSE